MGGGETQQLGDARGVGAVLGQAFLQYRTELVPEVANFSVLARQPVDWSSTRRVSADLSFHLAAVLQDSRETFNGRSSVDHAAYETQVVRQHLLGRVHDENA